MKFIAVKTNDGESKGNTTFYCKMLHVSRQGFYKHLANQDRPWNYQDWADIMMQIQKEEDCNDTYGRIRMYQALILKQLENVDVPTERTVYRIMEEIGLSHHPKHKPNGITKADREAHKSEDLLKRDFKATKPLTKCVTDMTQIKARDELSRTFSSNQKKGVSGNRRLSRGLKCRRHFFTSWIDVEYIPDYEDKPALQMKCNLRRRKPSLLRNLDLGHPPFRAILSKGI